MICVSLANKSFAELKNFVSTEALVELRLDLLSLSKEELVTLCAGKAKIIVTFRPKKEVSEQERLEALKLALLCGAAFVDIELETESEYREELIPYAKTANAQIIISYHNFKETPELADLKRYYTQAKHLGADIIKIATQVNSQEDAARLLALHVEQGRKVIIGMGELGKIVRVAAPLIGSEFTFAAADEESLTAPGQMVPQELKEILKVFKG